MRKISILVMSSFLLFYCFCFDAVSTQEASLQDFSYPAEWEPHDAIWLGFRTIDEGIVHEPLLQQIITSLAPHVRVKVLVEDISLLPEGPTYFSRIGVDPMRIDIVVQDPVDFWIRDPGPLFLVNPAGKLAVADFLFSNYADVGPGLFTPKAIAHGGIDTAIARRLGAGIIPSRAILEGGAFEVNGRGTILLSEMTKKRNPHLTTRELELEICKTLGQKKVIWLKEGLAEDPRGLARITKRYWGRGTGGHVDEFVRFVSEHTVLLAWPSTEDHSTEERPIGIIDSIRMAENHRLLAGATTQDGKTLDIIHFPVPDLLVRPLRISSEEISSFQQQDSSLKIGDVLMMTAAASYLNYVITNDVILMPAYWHEGLPDHVRKKDAQARSILEKYFPNRAIIQLDPSSLNFLGGGMHCITMQQPQI
jgi:agmatine deiminase